MIEFRPIPPRLLTAEEATQYLRLDEGRSTEQGIRALRRYVARGELRAAVVGNHRRFDIRELDRFIETKTEKSTQDG